MNFNVDEILNGCEKTDMNYDLPALQCVHPSETPFDPTPFADFHRPGENLSEKQAALVQEIKSAEYLVYSTKSRKFVRFDMHDSR